MSQRNQLFNEDVARFVMPRTPPRGLRLLAKVLSEPGLQFAWLARVQISLESRGRGKAARAVHLLNLRLTGAEFGHGCSLGGGLVVKHPLGMVVGGGTRLGQNCTVLHNVTFGERRPEEPSLQGGMYPVVGDGCLIGTSAILLGPILVGDNAKVGAGAIVLDDVRPGATVVGAPARDISVARNVKG